MPSILSRLRTRAVSQTSRHSAQSVHPAPTTATTVTTPTHDEQADEEGRPISEPTTQVQGSAPVTRMIYRDLDLLTDELARKPSSIRRGLSPPVRRGPPSSSNPSTPILGPDKPSVLQAMPAKGDSDSPKVSRSSSSSGNSTPDGRGFIERLGDWSTFGRRRAPPPSLNEFGTAQMSPSPSAWRARRANSRLSSSRPSSNRTTASTHSSPHENNKESTPRPSYQSAARSNSHKRISTFGGAREVAPDSSPAHTEVNAHTVPPLPPLDHPALRSRGTMATYPPRVRRTGAPGRHTFGRTLRPYRSLPRVQYIFRSRLNEEEGKVLSRAGDDKGQGPTVAVPTVGSANLPVSIPVLPIPSSSSPSPPSSASSSSKSAPAAGSRVPHGPVPVPSNLYDPHISIIGNVVPMQQDVPRVHDRKPLRSSLKASARPPIASSSSSNGGASVHMPSFSLVAAVATASDGAVPRTPLSSPARSETAKGKRKAEDVDTTPPDPKRATFAVPASPREHLSSLAPSSYHNKRARLSAPSPAPTPSNAHNTGTYSSRTSSRLARAPSSTRSAPTGTNTGTGTGPPESASERERRRSVSQRSIPISALVTPHAPSIGRASSAYHMRDPRRPPRHMETGWTLRFRTMEEEGSPAQAWLFYIALVLFPLWLVGAVWRVPKTRVVGGTDTEKAVPLDDPQIEFDARSWRFRCRVMAAISLFTYVPFIILVAIFASR